MEVLNGSDLMLFFTDGGTTKTIAFATSHKIQLKLKTKEKSSKDSGMWAEVLAGRMSWSISADALMASDSSNFKELYTLMIARTPIDIYSCLAEGTAPSWTKKAADGFTGKAIITALDADAKDEDNGTMSITLDGTGAYSPVPVV